jgi:hypothetical protein
MNTLLEYTQLSDQNLPVDRAAQRIAGVKILGLRSKNNRIYLPEALLAAVSLYEGAKVNINHPRGAATSPRDYQDRFGSLLQVRFVPEQGLFGDLLYNPMHPLAEQLLWDAEHAPQQVGLSHNVTAVTAEQNGELVVTEILSVQSVDLVADPATTQGLYEATTTNVTEQTITLTEWTALQTEVARLSANMQQVEQQLREALTNATTTATTTPPRSWEQSYDPQRNLSQSEKVREFAASLKRG